MREKIVKYKVPMSYANHKEMTNSTNVKQITF